MDSRSLCDTTQEFVGLHGGETLEGECELCQSERGVCVLKVRSGQLSRKFYRAETVVLRYHLVQGFNVQAEEED